MSADNIYHERQRMWFCAIHALNNLLQRPEFTQNKFNHICMELSPHYWSNPHRNMLGLGNYDVNVIMKALSQVQLDMLWYDKRIPVARMRLENIVGFIVNIESETRVLGMAVPFWPGRHWFAILPRWPPGVEPGSAHSPCHFYNLDSKLDRPVRIADNADAFRDYLTRLLHDKPDIQIFVVVTEAVSHSGEWKHSE